jgi:hypothetical protein
MLIRLASAAGTAARLTVAVSSTHPSCSGTVTHIKAHPPVGELPPVIFSYATATNQDQASGVRVTNAFSFEDGDVVSVSEAGNQW